MLSTCFNRKEEGASGQQDRKMGGDISETFNTRLQNTNPSSESSRNSLLKRASMSMKALSHAGLSATNMGAEIPKKLLRVLRIMPGDDVEGRRQLAAVKIQRAWRRARIRSFQRSMDASNNDMNDVAWRRRSGDGGDYTEVALRRGRPGSRRPDWAASSLAPGTAKINGNASSPGKSSSKAINESQVGTAMRELTGQRVAIGIIVALAMTVFFT